MLSAQAHAGQVSYFSVPEGAHPHDVAPAPDGTVWYTAQHQGAIGVLDPKSGAEMQKLVLDAMTMSKETKEQAREFYNELFKK